MDVVKTEVGPIGTDVQHSPDDGGWYGEVVAPDGSTAHTTEVMRTEGEAGRAAVAAIPDVVERLKAMKTADAVTDGGRRDPAEVVR